MLSINAAFWIAYFTGYFVFFILYTAFDKAGDTTWWENILFAFLWPLVLFIVVIVSLVDYYDLYQYNKRKKNES